MILSVHSFSINFLTSKFSSFRTQKSLVRYKLPTYQVNTISARKGMMWKFGNSFLSYATKFPYSEFPFRKFKAKIYDNCASFNSVHSSIIFFRSLQFLSQFIFFIQPEIIRAISRLNNKPSNDATGSKIPKS